MEDIMSGDVFWTKQVKVTIKSVDKDFDTCKCVWRIKNRNIEMELPLEILIKPQRVKSILTRFERPR